MSAGDQHGAPDHDERPECVGLDLRHGPDRVVRADGPHRGGQIHAVVVQERGDRDRELADRPRAVEVAEVDDPVRDARDGVAGDHVVVGEVAVDELHRQPIGDRCHGIPRGGRRGSQLLPQRGVCRRTGGALRARRGDCAQIPLVHPLGLRCVEVGQRDVDGRGERADRAHGGGGEVARERLALEELEQPCLHRRRRRRRPPRRGAVGEGQRSGCARTAMR